MRYRRNKYGFIFDDIIIKVVERGRAPPKLNQYQQQQEKKVLYLRVLHYYDGIMVGYDLHLCVGCADTRIG